MTRRVPELDRGLSRAAADDFGLDDEQAAWVAAVCQLSGVWTDQQLAWGLDLSARKAADLARRWMKRGWVREHRFAGLAPVRHVLAKPLYADLGIADVRFRKLGADGDLEARRRLLGLDAVLQLGHELGFLPWCATEEAKLAAADSYGVPREELPARTYAAPAGETVRYFVPKRPIAIPSPAPAPALRAGPPAVFVWTADGETLADPLRTWAAGLAGVWRRLAAAGVPLRVVGVTAEPGRVESMAAALRALPAEARRASDPDGDPDPELLQLRGDIARGAYGEHGSLDAALRAYAALKEAAAGEGACADPWHVQALLARRVAATAAEAPAAGGGRTVKERHHDTMAGLLAELRAGEVRMTVGDVARELGVSERTVRRNWGAQLADARKGLER